MSSSEVKETKENLFPEIRHVAEETDQLPDVDDDEIAEKRKETDGDEDEEAKPVQEIESLCMNCENMGTTRLLLTSIPYFREVIVMSFRCEHCGWSNNEIQSAGQIREHGATYTLHVLSPSDFNRQIVKSATCTVSIPELELTIPPVKGQLTTVEGLLRDIVADLQTDQPLRRIQNEKAWEKINTIIQRCKEVVGGYDEDDEDLDEATRDQRQKERSDVNRKITPLTIILDDPSGNSFIEFIGSTADPRWNMRIYARTLQQNVDLGLIAPEDINVVAQTTTAKDAAEALKQVEASEGGVKDDQDDQVGGGLEGPNEEIYVFPGVCSSCGRPLNTMMKKVNIPYFKDIIIMSTNCDKCGYRDNEVKSGSAISEKGKRITLKVEDKEDLNRDVLKSETCGVTIPEIDLVLHPGTLGGRFTTVEGLLEQVFEELSEKVFVQGDAVTEDHKSFESFLGSLKECKEGTRTFTLILEDPLANSYLQNLYAPDPDPQMEVVQFERSWEQNEELGLNDIRVEGYGEREGVRHDKLEAEGKGTCVKS